MAKGQWHACAQVSVGELLVVRDIRATDAGGFDGNLHLANGRVLNGSSFLYVVMLVDVVLRLALMRLGTATEVGEPLCNRQIRRNRRNVPIASREDHARQTQ